MAFAVLKLNEFQQLFHFESNEQSTNSNELNWSWSWSVSQNEGEEEEEEAVYYSILPESFENLKNPTGIYNNDYLYDQTDESTENDGSNEANDSFPAYPGILDTDLTSLTTTQRTIFMVIVLTLFTISILGNTMTLFVNARRKIRPFFRACLISLACSDLMNSIFVTITYVSQFTAQYVQVWRLGFTMCGLVPFATTAAILASSITLVCIALDRYFAVMKAVIRCWNPGLVFCLVTMFAIWITSVGIASPVFFIYTLISVYILTVEDDNLSNLSLSKFPSDEDVSFTLVKAQGLVNMCVSQSKDVTLYYVIVFVLIFIPSIVAFVWLNSIIARKLWKRRHRIGKQKKQKKSFLEHLLRSKQQEKIEIRIELENRDESDKTKGPPDLVKDANEGQLGVTVAEKCTCQRTQQQISSSTVPSSFLWPMGSGVSSKKNLPLGENNGVSTPILNPKIQIPAYGGGCGGVAGVGVVGATGDRSCMNPMSSSQAKSREARHMRMFIIIIVMMAVFIFFRLPAWIFLIMRMYGNYTKPIHWILYFSFGILNLSSCCLNPLFYTFLTQTIQYFLLLKEKSKRYFCCCCCCCGGKPESEEPIVGLNPQYGACNHLTNLPPKETKAKKNSLRKCLDHLSCCQGLRNKLPCQEAKFMKRCKQSSKKPGRNEGEICFDKDDVDDRYDGSLPRPGKAKESKVTFYEKDEGVDCSDDGDSINDDFNDFNRRIYTIFPPSLVSSSVNSD